MRPLSNYHETYREGNPLPHGVPKMTTFPGARTVDNGFELITFVEVIDFPAVGALTVAFTIVEATLVVFLMIVNILDNLTPNSKYV